MASNILKRLRNPPFGMDTSERLLIEAAAEHVAALEADLAKERAENARMREALKKLANEVGCLEQFEHGMRAEIGNTNWSVLFARLDEANAALR